MMTSRRNFNLMALGATFAGAATLADTRGARADANNTVTMQASWVNDAEFLGYFVGIQNGYYKAEGVDMVYLSGGPDVIPESALLAGKAPLALTTPDTTIDAITKQGAKFKIIGTQFQKSPLGVVSLASNPILKPSALKGKVLAVPPVAMTMIHAFMKINGLAKSDLRIVPYEYDPMPLIKGEIDATVDFVTDVPYTIGLQGKKAVSFLLWDYGVTLYNDTVVVTEDFLTSNRPLLVKWLRASRRGWDENLKDPALYPKQFKDSWFKGTGRATDNDVFTNTADKPLIESPHGIFTMTEDGIAQNIDYLNRIGIKADRARFDTTLVAEI
jgi:ABC-type nitrate/sulfonate/bicarbonate transport system substrate-binding protein